VDYKNVELCNCMKILFITQAVYLSQSLITHILNIENDTVDLIINKKIIGKDINIEYAHKVFKNKVNTIYECILPLYNCYIGRSTSSIHKWSSVIKKLMYPVTMIKVKNIMKSGKYSYIYLNSLILHKLITKEYPFILHVRERYDGSDPSVNASLMKAAGVIFIDATVAESFKDLDLKHKMILNNPFDMHPDLIHTLKINLDTNKTIFSVVGRIEDGKGTPLIIDAFKKANLENSILLIVGFGGNMNYVNACMNKAHGNENIIFYGVEENIQLIYDVTDYVVRGESEQCIGRTMYEGLYSGCEVIVPGQNMACVFENNLFQDKIHFYKPSDVDQLATLFKKFNGNKIVDRIYRSNAKEYVQEFDKFISGCLC
jgi:glycosyltransferase involved in cell wall biosynthesis